MYVKVTGVLCRVGDMMTTACARASTWRFDAKVSRRFVNVPVVCDVCVCVCVCVYV